MIILVGASASGKTETAKELGKSYGMKKAVTTTTRKIRNGEKDGLDYFFLTEEEFLKRAKEGRFVENACYAGNFYGCGKDQVAKDRVLIVEPNGLRSFEALNDKTIVSFFISVDERIREERMRSRGDKESDIENRLKNDKVHFSIKNVGTVDHTINADNMNVEEVAKAIYELYQKSLLTRGL